MKNKNETIECLKANFNTTAWKDKYGMVTQIKELDQTFYNKDIAETMRTVANGYKFALSKTALEMIKTLEEKDNTYARFMNMREYEIVKVTIVKGFVDVGVTLRFKDTGEERFFIETGLSYALKNPLELWDYINRKRGSYWVAGGLKDEDADFIFKNVGFSSKIDMYGGHYDNKPERFVDDVAIQKLIKEFAD